ncbi:hypothetical protein CHINAEXTREME_11865 [Halobiforma lacisalsi AJ5]|uniref:Uncharacterized protein n=1 Tax=Natronobacterium lacisalsi AJ5 TaxID=358396 RepID=M0LDD8_NATLA|nr:hypothetical protein [Halobiforma lacisalsi]APW98436.1 hypothetical protein CHINAEXTREME_11865 [Halobiforma lacisalsi AJ5]EMA31123.1 hypothetical protein C445_15206 [Halobiforma lacisalsi AJ5]
MSSVTIGTDSRNKGVNWPAAKNPENERRHGLGPGRFPAGLATLVDPVDVSVPGDRELLESAVSVVDDGSGIPEMEREALTEGEETSLLHGRRRSLDGRLARDPRRRRGDDRGDRSPWHLVTLLVPAADEE